VELRLEGNPLVFPPPGILSQGAEAVLDFIRGHRHSDLFSAESERSAQQVSASRDQLLQSLSEAEARADESSPSAETAEAAEGEHEGGGRTEGGRRTEGGARAAPTARTAARSAQRRNNSGFFS
tara:strand:+ start:73 stop:444 length:372 start_codon:yes stop_codon:yes gene_type:complete